MKNHSLEALKLLSESELHELKGGENHNGSTSTSQGSFCSLCIACATGCTACKTEVFG